MLSVTADNLPVTQEPARDDSNREVRDARMFKFVNGNPVIGCQIMRQNFQRVMNEDLAMLLASSNALQVQWAKLGGGT